MISLLLLGVALDKIEVFCVDYGKRVYTAVDAIRPLHPDFAKLPCYSIRCALSQVITYMNLCF